MTAEAVIVVVAVLAAVVPGTVHRFRTANRWIDRVLTDELPARTPAAQP